jgi:His/Glu/Gln/Arg/opine family amino acid ABC transporter permease subunit
MDLLSFGASGWGDEMAWATLMTLTVSLCAFSLALVIGTICAAGKLSRHKPLRILLDIYTTLGRGIPELLIIYLLFFGGSNAVMYLSRLFGYHGYIEINAFTAGVIAIALINGAYQTEVFRGAVLAIPTLGLNWTRGFLELPGQLYMINLLHLVFFAYVAIVMLRYLFYTQRVTVDMIFAALCTYLIIGLAWMFIYSCIELRLPGSFSSIPANDYQAQLHDFLYYSFVTLSTLGYGDVTPLNEFAKPWAIIESIIGQFYLAVVLARLVGLQISSRNLSPANRAGT